MGIFFSEHYDDLRDLLISQLRDLYDAEHRILEALPRFAEKALSPALKRAITSHISETKTQIGRLEKSFDLMDSPAERETCQACLGLIKEASEMLEAKGSPSVIDAGLIAAAQRIEHYEIAGYGCARAFAEQLGLTEVAKLLEESLDEEREADFTLSETATSRVNAEAMEHSHSHVA